VTRLVTRKSFLVLFYKKEQSCFFEKKQQKTFLRLNRVNS